MKANKSIENSVISAFKEKQKEEESNQREEAARQREETYNSKIEDLTKEVENLKADKNNRREVNKSQGTARQIALAFYYLRNSDIFPNLTGTNTVDAEFLNFLTGKDIDSIRKNLKDPKKISRNEITGKATKELIEDLILIKSRFEKILFNKGIEKINRDIEALEKDQDSF